MNPILSYKHDGRRPKTILPFVVIHKHRVSSDEFISLEYYSPNLHRMFSIQKGRWFVKHYIAAPWPRPFYHRRNQFLTYAEAKDYFTALSIMTIPRGERE